MYACIIMHNMIVEDEGEVLTDWASDDVDVVGPSHGVATPMYVWGYPMETPIGSVHLPTCANDKPIFDSRMI